MMSVFKIFVVEDDPWYGQILKYHLSLNPDYEVSLFASGRECLDKLHLRPDVICIDFNLPDFKGDALLTRIQSVNQEIPVIVISAQEEISVALNLLKIGAYDYIIKDDNAKELVWNSVKKARENKSLKNEVEELKERLEEKFDFEKTIIGQSGAVRRVFPLIEKAIRNNIAVSISGETGTGKEVVAKTIHYNSDRKKKPFVAVNMAAIPSELVESELFGHEKGAFTGAVAKRIGKFEEANGGTIFLDEIADMDMNMQAKLLRVLQEREVVRIGGSETVKLDVRVITATHKRLAEQVKSNLFREDLYYRILGLPIELPPLRERGEDILILAKHFIKEFSKANHVSEPELSASARKKLMEYNFPGNVRELKAMIELACVMSNGTEIAAADISFPSFKGNAEFLQVEKTLAEYNWDIISYYLKKYQNNVLLVASKLNIGKSTIYNLLKTRAVEA
jgi:two-component system, NtrC family, response regulator AtoC